MYFIFMAVAQDEESQRRGSVGIMYNIDPVPNAQLDFDFHKRSPGVLQSMPLRACALHMCSNDPLMQVVNSILLARSPSNIRARFRVCGGE